MAKYYYIVDLNERGYYYAHVTDAKTEQKNVFSLSNEYQEIDDDNVYNYYGEISLVQDGFMKHGKDMNGLFWYLVNMKILKESDELIYRG